MAVYISLLRGINVGGPKIIKMADLRAIYQQLSFQYVQSYIQSGNVIFSSVLKDHHVIEQKLKDAIFNHYQFDVPVFILSPNTLKTARDNLPFSAMDVAEDGSKLLLCFLSESPRNAVDLLTPYLKNSERLSIVDKVLYLHCQEGYGKSKLSHSMIEKKLQVRATSRNLKTVEKLISLTETLCRPPQQS